MHKKESILIFSKLLILFYALIAEAKAQPKMQGLQPMHINYQLNRITYGNLVPFLEKLKNIEDGDSGVVSIVQIGDSHTQPDMISSVVRKGLQNKFGDAGRGLVFPYQLAKSNTPKDIRSSSNINWVYNRLAHPELGLNSGISGFVINTTNKAGELTISVSQEGGNDKSNYLTPFFNADTSDHFIMTINQYPQKLRNGKSITLPGSLKDSFTIKFLNNDSLLSFYGCSLESGKTGIIYHNIGVNGARYDQYNQTPSFWRDLPCLKADLYIVSLGTNEAHKDSFNNEAFQQQIMNFINNLQASSPGATIILTTAADSYKKNKINAELKLINQAIEQFCLENKICLWNLYSITNGFGSARQWMRAGMLNKDKVHYLPAGYYLQGELLRNCLLNEYDRYIETKTEDR